MWPLKNKKTHIKEINGNSNPVEMANSMNDHFASVDEKLAAKFDDIEPLQTDREDEATDFVLDEIDPTVIWKLITNLQGSKACGIDGVTAWLMKDAGPSISDPIAHIINLSIKTSCFPSCWKVGLVTPIFKDGHRGEPNNYRPITLLSLISKLEQYMISCTNI